MMSCTQPGCDVVLPVNPRRKGTLCKRHAAAAVAQDPARNARIARTMKKILADPERREQRLAAAIAGHRALIAADAAYREQMRRQGERVGRGAYGRWIRHVPLEYRQLYLGLSDKISAAERLAIVRGQMEADQRKYERTGILPVTGGGQ